MDKVEQLISEFTVNLRRAIAEQAASAFAQIAMGGQVGNGKKASKKIAAKPAAKAEPAGRLRRNEADLLAQLDQVKSWLKKNPGSGVEAIGPGVNLSTKELAAVIQKGLATKALAKKGQRRATKYSVK